MCVKWSLEEETYLVNIWGQTDIRLIMKTLNRTEDSIVRKAQRLGIYTPKDPKDYIKKRWSEDEEKVLFEFYHTKPLDKLLLLLPNRTRESIIKKAKLLGINHENRFWTEEEIDFLEEKWGLIPIENIAKRLGRTRNAILLKAHKIGLREQAIANGEYLTPKDIAMILSVGPKTVYNWMDNDCLKFKKLKVNSIKKYQITISNFKLFLETYQEKWDSRIADIKFINSCFKPIPEWLMIKIELDKQKKSPLCRKQWTVKEELTLKSMMDRGRTYKEIAIILNRSFFSIQGKISSKRLEQLHINGSISMSVRETPQISSAG